MKPVLISILALITVHQTVRSQFNNVERVGSSPMLYTAELNGTRSSDEWNRRDIKGSPFLKDAFTMARITLPDKRSFDNVPVRLNCVNNTIHYRNSNNEELVAPPGSIREILLFDSSEKSVQTLEFACGYPEVNKHDSNTIYQRILNGNAQLLVFTKKRVVDGSTLGSPGAEKEWMGSDSYYAYCNGKMQAWEKGKDFLLAIVGDKRNAVAAFISKESLKCKSLNDCIRVLTYYNGLP